MAKKQTGANDPLKDLVNIQSNVPAGPVAGTIVTSAETAGVQPQAIAEAPQRILPPTQANTGMQVTQTGGYGVGGQQPVSQLVPPSVPFQAPLPTQSAQAPLPSHPTPPMSTPTFPQQPATPASNDEHQGEEDDFFDPMSADFDVEEDEFHQPVPMAMTPEQLQKNQMQSPAPSTPTAPAPAPVAMAAQTDPNAPPFDVGTPSPVAPAAQQPADPAAGGKRKRRTKAEMEAARAAEASGQAAPAPAPIQAPAPPQMPPTIPVVQQAPQQAPPTMPTMPMTQGGNTLPPPPAPAPAPAQFTVPVQTASQFAQGFVSQTTPGVAPLNVPLQPNPSMPLNVNGLGFDAFNIAGGPGMSAPASNSPETQVSEALMTFIENSIRQMYVHIGIGLLRDPNAIEQNNPVHAAIYTLRWQGETLDRLPIEQLNNIERALSYHQVYVSGIENFWEARYQVLAKELDAQMFRNRENYPGTTKQEKENNCQSQDPNMRQLRHHFMLAQGMAYAMRNIGERFKQWEDGLKRTISTVQIEMSKRMR